MTKENQGADARQEPMRDARQEPMRDARQEPMRDARQEPMRDARQEPMRDARQEPMRDARQEPMRDARFIADASGITLRLKSRATIEVPTFVGEVVGRGVRPLTSSRRVIRSETSPMSGDAIRSVTPSSSGDAIRSGTPSPDVHDAPRSALQRTEAPHHAVREGGQLKGSPPLQWQGATIEMPTFVGEVVGRGVRPLTSSRRVIRSETSPMSGDAIRSVTLSSSGDAIRSGAPSPDVHDALRSTLQRTEATHHAVREGGQLKGSPPLQWQGATIEVPTFVGEVVGRGVRPLTSSRRVIRSETSPMSGDAIRSVTLSSSGDAIRSGAPSPDVHDALRSALQRTEATHHAVREGGQLKGSPPLQWQGAVWHRVAGKLLVALALLLAGCPAPPLDDYYPWDATPWDVQPGDGSLHNPSGPPSCSPEAVVDVNARATRQNNVLTLTIDTRNARNDLHPLCLIDDGPEVVLRYRVPPASERTVAAVRFSTVTDATRSNTAHPDQESMPDPTTFDTCLSIRATCDGRDVDCSNDDVIANVRGTAADTRRSTVYQVGVFPEDEVLLVLDGNEGSSGIAQLTVEEIPRLGVLGAPCLPIPIQRALDPSAPTAYFRCPAAGMQCRPGAAGDGTDLCVPIVPLGARCDEQARLNVCDRANEGAICAANPSDEDDVKCAMPGTAAGAPCRGLRGSANRCDATLYCSEAAPMEGYDTCVMIRAAGDTCDPSPMGAINHCGDGLACCLFGDAGGETTCQPAGPACRPAPPEM